MARAGIIFLILYEICSAETVGNTEPSIVSVKVGESVTLNCTSALKDKSKTAYWFKHRLEHKPQEVGYLLKGKASLLQNSFKDSKSGFELKEVGSGFSLSIKQVQKEDEGMYFCGSTSNNSVKFSTGTFLAVSDPSDTSVLLTTTMHSVTPGEPVNLQCTVLSEIRSEDLRVFWIRSAAGSSFPEIIFTHHNSSSSSSRQCEISSSKHSSVYNFSPNIPNNHHAATYYCAVETCWRIIVGNGTTVEIKPSVQGDHSVLIVILSLVLGLSLIWNITLTFWSWRRGICSGKPYTSVLLPEVLQDLDGDDDEEFDFSALHFSDKMKRRVLKENIFTKVRITGFNLDKLTQ